MNLLEGCNIFLKNSTNSNISIEELYKQCKIKWSNFFVSSGDTIDYPECNFELEPEDYLNFAKNNLKTNTKQNCVDGITNIKRAIDSQIDLLISSLGYDFKVFDSHNNFVKNFINSNYKEELSVGINSKLKLLNILGLAPTCLISNIRNIRNQVEHEYTVPQYKDLKNAVEVGELFINSSSGKYFMTQATLFISNKFNQEKFECIPPFFQIRFKTGINEAFISIISKSIDSEILLTPKDEFYIELVSSFFNEDYKILPKVFKCTIDEQYVHYTNYRDSDRYIY